MVSWLRYQLRRHHLSEDGQVEAIVIALVIFLLILIISGRRVVVQ